MPGASGPGIHILSNSAEAQFLFATVEVRKNVGAMSNGVKRRRLSADGEFNVIESAETIPEPEKPETAPSDSPSRAQRRTLFVRSLPASTTTGRLTEFFSQSHPLKHAIVVLDPQTKASRGYGFVTFADPEDAQAAAEELHNADLDGQKIKVELADLRHREIVEGGGRSKPFSKAAELKAEREKKRGNNAPPRLIVRNLPWSIKEPEDLEALFRSYGKVKQAVVPNKGPKLQAGFGFVVLRGRKNAEKAIEGVNGKVVDGRQLAVDWAVEKEAWEKFQTEEQHADSGPGPSAGKTQKNGLEKTSLAESEELEPTSEVDIGESATSSESDNHDIHGIDIEEEEVEGMGSQDDEPREASSTTVFIRNLPFTSTDETLQAHFLQFGAVRYARIVSDPETERSRGTGFVCFFDKDNAKSCVKNAPRIPTAPTVIGDKKRRGKGLAHSVLQDEAVDPKGRYTMEGRVLQVSKALSKSDATRREAEGSSNREIRDHDKRRLYLLSEGTISKGSKLYEKLGPTEINIREESTKQRQKLIKNNPSLHVSLTRLSLRNIPRNVSSKDLKALAREAVVGFATDVKNGLRQPLSKEELKRAADSMKEAETLRKQKGKGIVKQAKIVFEGREGAKVDEKSDAGRSRGYGFVEYMSHRAALMGLRWLNGHAVKARGEERSKRLIVEFAIENAQVVARRKDREVNVRTPRPTSTERSGKQGKEQAKGAGKKRKRNDSPAERTKKKDTPRPPIEPEQKNNLAKRNRIIAKKRTMRKSRRAG